MAYVFIYTVPNPMTGFVVAVLKKEITPLNMSIEEGLKLVISAGVVVAQQSDSKKDSLEFNISEDPLES
jgi:uncharacterized membrane protein